MPVIFSEVFAGAGLQVSLAECWLNGSPGPSAQSWEPGDGWGQGGFSITHSSGWVVGRAVRGDSTSSTPIPALVLKESPPPGRPQGGRLVCGWAHFPGS